MNFQRIGPGVESVKRLYNWYVNGEWQAEWESSDTLVDRIRKFHVGAFIGLITGVIEAFVFSLPIWITIYTTEIATTAATSTGIPVSELIGIIFFTTYIIGLFSGFGRMVKNNNQYGGSVLSRPHLFSSPVSATIMYTIWISVTTLAALAALVIFGSGTISLFALFAGAYLPIYFVDTVVNGPNN